ncbi:MAG: hypothetical protein CO146_02595 [Candidatus Nealsonbacteria bacterium CG_4_9_14_3_um_filter_37_29]|uniref:Uncharacterized protein n=1 Tax=Candidatus Nealsonbacteria bacterium CG_4_9_14_3_um_filter_37_29 TaxID=1974696 RepID=A0A2M7Z2R6_9BACT|nr:MAG: hypothetical protein CO146_02595 [Candidatus Nealsonbacteria bacterium CG_4_9_14_3_um_filter_37_29]
MKKEKFITEKYLDKRFEQHSQVIIAAVDGILEKRLGKMEERLEKKINNVQILIDGYVKAQEDFKQEFVIMKQEMKQMKKVIKEKLGIEIRAI